MCTANNVGSFFLFLYISRFRYNKNNDKNQSKDGPEHGPELAWTGAEEAFEFTNREVCAAKFSRSFRGGAGSALAARAAAFAASCWLPQLAAIS